jgi:cell division septation protein DedD
MNDKKDDSEEKYDPKDDTASLLESLFKDTKSSQIKVVRRRIRPKSGFKKRLVSKQRKDAEEKPPQALSQKQGRPSPSIRSTEATKSKTLSQERPLPASTVSKDSRTEQSRQKLHHKSTAVARPSSISSKSGDQRVARPGGPNKERPASKTIAGPGEERTESLDPSVLNSMISMASGIKGSRKSPHHELSPEERQLLKTKEGGGERFPEADDVRTGSPEDIRGISGTDEEITQVMEKTALDSMISELEGSGEEGDDRASTKEEPAPEEEEDTAEIFFDSDDLSTGPPADIKGISGTDEEITEVMEKTTLDSMISELEGSGEEGDDRASAKENPVSEEEEGTAEIFFDSDDLSTGPPADIENTAGADKEITDVLEKSALNTMISAFEESGKEGEDKASAKENPVSDEGEDTAEMFFDSDGLKAGPLEETGGITWADDEITEILDKTALNAMISEVEGGGKEGEDEASTEESSVSEEEETVVGIVADSDDLKEEVSADTEEIDGAIEEGPLSQEKPAAPSSISIEDSSLEAGTYEAYPDSTLEEKSISEGGKEAVEEAPQAVHLEEEQPPDSADAKLTKEKSPSQEDPVASTPMLSKIPGTEVDVFEVHHILEDEERSILEDRKENIERGSEAVGVEIEPLSDSSGPAKEEQRFQEILTPSFMSPEDSKVNTGEEDHYPKPATEEEPVLKGKEVDIQRISESTKSLKEKTAELEEEVVLSEAELQLIKKSGRHSKVIRIGLPLVLFGILAVVLSIQYLPLDFFKREPTQKLTGDKNEEISSPKKQGVTPKTLREKAPAIRQGVQPSTPASVEKEIVRAPVPRKRDVASQPRKETVSAVSPEVQPSTSEPPTILGMKESVEGSSPTEQDTTPKTSKETFVATKQEVRPESPEAAIPPPLGDATVRAETNQKETSTSYPYSIYLGSYGTLERAEKAVLKYKENGLSSLYWQEVDLGDKGVWYRVFTGHFETKNEAEEYVKERQLVDAEVRKAKSGASRGSVSVKDVVPQAKAPEKPRLLTEPIAGSSYPYSVYVGSYKDVDYAQKAASDLQTKGPSYWVKTDLGDKGIWYRVYVGCFQTREQAERFIETHQITDGQSRRTTYANLIGTYSSEEELDRMRQSLTNLGFSPYVIEASGGRSHLFAGAFYQKVRAEKERLDLKAKGIQSQLVER